MTDADGVWDALLPHEKEALEKAERKFSGGLQNGNPYADLPMIASSNIEGTWFSIHQAGGGKEWHLFSEKNRFTFLLSAARQWAAMADEFFPLFLKSAADELSEDETLELETFGLLPTGDGFALAFSALAGPAPQFLSRRLIFSFFSFLLDALNHHSPLEWQSRLNGLEEWQERLAALQKADSAES